MLYGSMCALISVCLYIQYTTSNLNECKCMYICVCTYPPGSPFMALFSAFPIFTLTPLKTRSFPFLRFLSDRKNCYSQTVIMWCELWLPPDSPMTIHWHRANVSRAVRKPHDGNDCSERARERREGKGGEAWELYFVMWFLPLCFLYDLV